FSSLGSLSLGDFELKANIVDVHCLTSLTLDDMSCDTWDELFNLLRSSPALEHLAFGGLDIDAMAIPTDTRIRPILNLQYLKSFKFLHYGGHAAMSFLLAHLALPCTAKIKIDTYLDASGQVVHEDENADLHHGILIADIVPKDNITLPAFAAVQALHIEFGYCSFDVKAFTPEDLGPCRTDTTTITFSCYLADFFNLRSVQRQIMPELGTVFPRSLTVLHVRVEGGYCYDTRQDSIELWESWESLYYEVFLDLEEFHASGPTPDFFTDFLFDIGPSSPQLREFDSLPWPMLKRIKHTKQLFLTHSHPMADTQSRGTPSG
ncbi:uncharacterized protein B0H18DRAFT_1170529, partial [Fomitopsis serialis]|uniref:uncharacterized protein n=1 Tax=Fomitopsis serialis TaxID=139415 RepID=UPI00200816F6